MTTLTASLVALLSLWGCADDPPGEGLADDTAAATTTGDTPDDGSWDRPRDGEPDVGDGGGGTDTTDPEPRTERRHDCQAMDPADAAPLGGYVALTFDDGPRAETTPQILDVLRRHEVPATFFVLGDRLGDPSTWDIVDEILADPLFEIANHSTSHPSMTDLSLTEATDEVDTTTALIEDFGGDPAFFRFPYGLSDCDRADMVRDRGYRVAGWHIDTADWCYATGTVGECDPDEDYWRIPDEYTADMMSFTTEQLLRYDGGVVLLHDIHQFTADAVEDIILSAQAEGLVFTRLDDADAFPNLNAGTPHDFPWQGEACSTAADQCWQVEYMAWCEPTAPDDPGSAAGICTVPCEGYCLDRDGAAVTFCADAAPGAGQCTAYAEELNTWCEAVPGAEAQEMDRFVGSSGASDYTAGVCAPEHWLD